MRIWFWLIVCAGIAESQLYLWRTELPLGIPGEWTWGRIASEPDAFWNLAGLAGVAALYVVFVEAGARRLSVPADRPRRRLERSAWLIGLAAAAFTWLWVVQEAAPVRNRLGKSAFVLFYPGSSGYFTRARYVAPDPGAFLAGYEDLMRQRDVLHVGTHPPGLVLVFHGLIGACQRSPSLSAFLEATQPASFRDACDVIARNSARSVPPRPLLPEDRRVLWGAALLVMAAAALSVIPLHGLIGRSHDAATAWRAAALWPALPAVAVFIPKSDVAYAFVGLLIVAAWQCTLDRRSVLLAFLAGLLAWSGLMMSLAFLPVLLFAAIVGWRPRVSAGETSAPGEPAAQHSEPAPQPDAPQADAPQPDAPQPDNGADSQIPRAAESTKRSGVQARLVSCLSGLGPVRCLAAALAGFALPTALLGWCGVNLLSVWWLNYQNHAAFYDAFSRSYWKWLLVNPVELAFAAGWPAFVLAAIGILNWIRRPRWEAPPVTLAVLIVWGGLWLTGKNSGEAARLWIVFMPWLVWLAARPLTHLGARTEKGGIPRAVLLAQLATCALTAAKISGFDN